jgi:hypothetical protein
MKGLSSAARVLAAAFLGPVDRPRWEDVAIQMAEVVLAIGVRTEAPRVDGDGPPPDSVHWR